MVILVDMDGVLENFSEEWTNLLNRKYGTSVSYEDLTNWDMQINFPTLSKDQIHDSEFDKELYFNLKPLPGAAQFLEKLLSEGHTIFVVTNTPYQIIPLKMSEVLFKFYPFLTWKNVIITSNKQMIKGDVLIDDAPHNLIGGTYHKILIDAPYNRTIDDAANNITRVHDWTEVYESIQSLSFIHK